MIDPIILCLIGLYLFVLPTFFRAHTIWTSIYFKILPTVMGAFLLAYGGMQIPLIVEIFTTT